MKSWLYRALSDRIISARHTRAFGMSNMKHMNMWYFDYVKHFIIKFVQAIPGLNVWILTISYVYFRTDQQPYTPERRGTWHPPPTPNPVREAPDHELTWPETSSYPAGARRVTPNCHRQLGLVGSNINMAASLNFQQAPALPWAREPFEKHWCKLVKWQCNDHLKTRKVEET